VIPNSLLRRLFRGRVLSTLELCVYLVSCTVTALRIRSAFRTRRIDPRVSLATPENVPIQLFSDTLYNDVAYTRVCMRVGVSAHATAPFDLCVCMCVCIIDTHVSNSFSLSLFLSLSLSLPPSLPPFLPFSFSFSNVERICNI